MSILWFVIMIMIRIVTKCSLKIAFFEVYTPFSHPPPITPVLLAAEGRQPADELNGVHIVRNDHLQNPPMVFWDWGTLLNPLLSS